MLEKFLNFLFSGYNAPILMLAIVALGVAFEAIRSSLIIDAATTNQIIPEEECIMRTMFSWLLKSIWIAVVVTVVSVCLFLGWKALLAIPFVAYWMYTAEKFLLEQIDCLRLFILAWISLLFIIIHGSGRRAREKKSQLTARTIDPDKAEQK